MERAVAAVKVLLVLSTGSFHSSAVPTEPVFFENCAADGIYADLKEQGKVMMHE